MKIRNATPEKTKDDIAGHINFKLQSSRVLLLLSGGSNIELGVGINNTLVPAHKLTIALIDERYGPVGHKDSNWQQLLDAGLSLESRDYITVLGPEKIEDASAQYAARLGDAFSSHDYVVGLFGMGLDGHTSGILPGSPAVFSQDIVTHYHGPDFDRVTTTTAAFNHFHSAFLAAYGEAKKDQLLNLLSEEVSVKEQPSQILKKVPMFTIFTDQLENTD